MTVNMAHITEMQNKLAMLEEDILMKAFKNDDDDVLYNWILEEYIDVCGIGGVDIYSLIKKYKKQEKGTLEELQYVEHLYNTYVNEYLREKNGLKRFYY